MNAERLLKLAGGLDILPPEKFSYEVIVSGDDIPRGSFDCGSTACAIGWAPVFIPECFEYNQTGRYINVVDKETGGALNLTNRFASIALKRAFDLTDDQAIGLFCPRQQERIGEPVLGDDASPKEVALMIRRFVAANS